MSWKRDRHTVSLADLYAPEKEHLVCPTSMRGLSTNICCREPPNRSGHGFGVHMMMDLGWIDVYPAQPYCNRMSCVGPNGDGSATYGIPVQTMQAQ